jgi:hypothetical protein
MKTSLIAAAPDMLEALKACVNELEYIDYNMSGKSDVIQRLIFRGHTAIAKAEGDPMNRTLTIRNLDDRIREAAHIAATRNKVSFNTYILKAIEHYVQHDAIGDQVVKMALTQNSDDSRAGAGDEK